MKDLVRWSIPQSELDSPAVQNRNLFAQRFADGPIEEALLTYTKMTLAEAKQLIDVTEHRLLDEPFAGRGIELGAGTALLSCALAGRPRVEHITAVEYVPDVVRLIQPRVLEHCLAPADRSKVTRALGSFDHLELPDESLDFAIEIGCLHHSNDLPLTLREIHRVLKKGGRVVGYDRVQPDSMSDEEVERLLDRVYDRGFLERFGYPLDQRLTRRQNGEHEYRRREWQAAFDAAGFADVRFHQLERRADAPMRSFARLLGLAASRPKRGSARYELRLWLSQLRRRAPAAALRSTVFVLRK